MDAIDARVDYLEIDKWMDCGKVSEVVKYCDEIGCNINDVLQIWICATNNSNALILDENYYFDYHTMNMDSNPVIIHNGISSTIIGTKNLIEIEATSELPLPPAFYDDDWIKERKIMTLLMSGFGYVKNIVSHTSMTTIIISAHNLKP